MLRCRWVFLGGGQWGEFFGECARDFLKDEVHGFVARFILGQGLEEDGVCGFVEGGLCKCLASLCGGVCCLERGVGVLAECVEFVEVQGCDGHEDICVLEGEVGYNGLEDGVEVDQFNSGPGVVAVDGFGQVGALDFHHAEDGGDASKEEAEACGAVFDLGEVGEGGAVACAIFGVEGARGEESFDEEAIIFGEQAQRLVLGDGQRDGLVSCEGACLEGELRGEVVANACDVLEGAARQDGRGEVEVLIREEGQGQGEEATDAGEEVTGCFKVAGLDGVGDHGAVVESDQGELEAFQVKGDLFPVGFVEEVGQGWCGDDR